MEGFKRYAIYFAPEPGPLADFGASWLGWDPESGLPVTHPKIADLDVAALTQTPRKYGLHGTIKPPFALAEASSIQALHDGMQALAARLAPVSTGPLALTPLGRFLALCPTGDTAPLAALAAEVVVELDPHRATLGPTDIARRNPDQLSDTQRALLMQWGYPYVMEEFRFHLTLTGKLPKAQVAPVEHTLAPVIAPLIAPRFHIASLCLFGEAEDGRFHNLHRYALTGPSASSIV